MNKNNDENINKMETTTVVEMVSNSTTAMYKWLIIQPIASQNKKNRNWPKKQKTYTEILIPSIVVPNFRISPFPSINQIQLHIKTSVVNSWTIKLHITQETNQTYIYQKRTTTYHCITSKFFAPLVYLLSSQLILLISYFSNIIVIIIIIIRVWFP